MPRETKQSDPIARSWLIAITLAVLGAAAAVAVVAAATVSMPQLPTQEVGNYTGMAVTDVRLIAQQNDWLLHEDQTTRTREAASSEALAGTVVGQHPLPATRLGVGETLTVRVVEGPPPRPAPNLVGLTAQQARATLALHGLEAAVTAAPSTDSRPPAEPERRPAVAAQLPLPSRLAVLNQRPAEQPDDRPDDRPVGTTAPPPALIVSQCPAPGTPLDRGARVEIVVAASSASTADASPACSSHPATRP